MPAAPQPLPRSSERHATPSHPDKRPFGLKWVFAGLLLVLILALVFRGSFVFHWRDLTYTFAHLSLLWLSAAAGCIYGGYVLRAVRWYLLSPSTDRQTGTPQPVLATFPAQLIGFTAISLFGRIADLVRPWLIARRLRTSLATQVAVYSVERVLDLAAAAAIIASPLLGASRPSLQHAPGVSVGRISLVALAAVFALGVIVLAMRLLGERLPLTIERLLFRRSPSLSCKAGSAVRDFQVTLRGLNTLRLLAAVAVSLVMWAGIALTYTCTARACQSSPRLAHLTFASTMPVLAASLGGSLLQLPVLGWFTQAGVLTAALHATVDVPLEPATACAVLIVCATNLIVLPAGLLAAQIGGIRLRDVSAESHKPA